MCQCVSLTLLGDIYWFGAGEVFAFLFGFFFVVVFKVLPKSEVLRHLHAGLHAI